MFILKDAMILPFVTMEASSLPLANQRTDKMFVFGMFYSLQTVLLLLLLFAMKKKVMSPYQTLFTNYKISDP